MEEQKTENKEELQQETTEEKNSDQGNSSTRSSLLWIFAGGYLVYTGYRLCANVISGAEDSSTGFLVAGGIFVVIGAVLLIMAVRNLAKAGAQKHEMEEAAAKKQQRKPPKIRRLRQLEKNACLLHSGHIWQRILMMHRRKKQNKIRMRDSSCQDMTHISIKNGTSGGENDFFQGCSVFN